MFRGFIGYLLGAIAGFTSFMFLIEGSIIVAVAIHVIALPIVLGLCHAHHVKKRKEYYDKIHGHC